jgi:hypothetical protein
MKTKKPDPPISLRLDTALLDRIQAVQDGYITSMNRPGFSVGPVKSLSRSQIARWALERGLDSIEAEMFPAKKKRS